MVNEWRIVGIDEAGRCPVAGPLIQAGILCKDLAQIKSLRELGVKDSKKLAPENRQELSALILGICPVRFKIWWPRDISGYSGSLNVLECMGIAELAKDLFDTTVHPRRICFHRIQKSGAPHEGIKIIQRLNPDAIIESVQNEDSTPIIAAASILATWLRTVHMEILRIKHPSIGSGEPRDPMTRRFIERNLHESWLPNIIRTKWITVKRIMEELNHG